jgi:hypothetical protein
MRRFIPLIAIQFKPAALTQATSNAGFPSTLEATP